MEDSTGINKEPGTFSKIGRWLRFGPAQQSAPGREGTLPDTTGAENKLKNQISELKAQMEEIGGGDHVSYGGHRRKLIELYKQQGLSQDEAEDKAFSEHP